MVVPQVSVADAAVLVVAVLVLAVPGTAVGLAAGLRGWRLAAGAPLFTCAVAGLGGPWTSAVGLPWGPWTLAAVTVVVAAVVGLLRWVVGPAGGPGALWERPSHLAVAACVAVAGLVGAAGVLVGLGRLGAPLGGWDAGFHVNGVRRIVDTGDGSVYGMTLVNWYDSPPRFYPNAYHLVVAVVDDVVPGQHVPDVLNAVTVLTPLLFALSLAALVHRFSGRAVTAGLAALLVVGAAPLVDLSYYGPLLPFAVGLAVLPAAVVFLADLVAAGDLRRQVATGALVVLAASSLVVLHPGILVTAVLFALPAAVFLAWSGRTVVRPLLGLVAAGLVTVAVCAVQVRGALSSGGGSGFDWPAAFTAADAIGQALLFEHGAATPQVGLALGLLVGLLTFPTLGGLRWILASTGVFGALYVVAAVVDAPWSTSITSPWWNDRWRLIAVAGLGLVVFAAHGFGEVHRRVRDLLAARLRPDGIPVRWLTAGLAVVLALAVGVLTNGLYVGGTEARVRNSVGAGTVVTTPTVTPLEEEGYAFLGSVVAPGERVMNDRWDGSLWMYALDGVAPVFGHYDSTDISPDQLLLITRFRHYDTEPAVRAAAERLHVRWAAVGTGTVTGGAEREPGLEGLDTVAALQRVYANPDITVYRLLPPPPGAAAPAGSP